MSLSMETDEFVTSAIKRLFDSNVSGGRDFDNMAKVLGAFPVAARDFTQQLSKSLDHPGVALLSKTVDNFIDLAAILFSKKVAGLSNAKVGFQWLIFENKSIFVSHWIGLIKADGKTSKWPCLARFCVLKKEFFRFF